MTLHSQELYNFIAFVQIINSVMPCCPAVAEPFSMVLKESENHERYTYENLIS